VKIYNAYKRATEHRGGPTVILAKTIKGYGLGDSAEGRNFAHNTKKLKDDQLAYVVKRFDMDVPEEKIDHLELHHPGAESDEIRYIKQRREGLGGYLPSRNPHKELVFVAPTLDIFKDVLEGTKGARCLDYIRFQRCSECFAKAKGACEIHRSDYSR
jgi:pyruvate dehydrogenase E1 component